MKPIKWIAVALLASVAVGAQSQSAPTPQAAAQASPPNPDFAAAQTLLQQGKYDEAIAQLQATAAKNPGLKGLSHELGTAYYKKGRLHQGD